MTMNATDPATADRIQKMLASTAPAVERVPIPEGPLETLRDELQALVLKIAEQVVVAEDAEGADSSDTSRRAATVMVTVIEAVAVETLKLQRHLWDEAARRGVSTSAVARARGVRQQTQHALSKRARNGQQK